ncbi:MAG: hypothetical protein IAA97_06905 [Spirochaetes bacterium]|uniref:DUF4374 domain-containing protein n=1 Tax=Candidatus Ornithospirochaeta stercoripullorum TaxID=2840899 RepID=A0A9D9DZZ4_9SPIO|nr:hypothetical protein [Candidatus Ornithospirochaeta stercoripullorum]
MRKNIYIALCMLSVLIAAVSCNLDSGQGVYQKVFNDTAKNYPKIQTVLGTIDGRIMIYANYDLYSFDGGQEMKKEADLSAYTGQNGGYGYVPFMAADSRIFFSYVDDNNTADDKSDDRYRFFSSSLDEIKEGLDKTENRHEVDVTLPSGDGSEIIKFNGLYNFTMDETAVLYTLSTDNQGITDPDDKITHYGFIEKDNAAADRFTIRGGAPVHSSSTIIGYRAVRTYAEDSEIEIGDATLSDTNRLYLIADNGASSTLLDVGDINYDNIVVGTDSQFFITFEGDLYRITGTNFQSVDTNFANDLSYRNNTIIPMYTDASGNKIGYLYEEGIYINPANRASDALPVKVNISDDNDLVTSCWIGDDGNGNYLMATQENGFWIVSLVNDNDDWQQSTIHQYNSEKDGALSTYLD